MHIFVYMYVFVGPPQAPPTLNHQPSGAETHQLILIMIIITMISIMIIIMTMITDCYDAMLLCLFV